MFTEPKKQGEVAEVALKLSQAIRIGAALRPQCTGLMFHDGKSCALGAAYEAVFGYPGNFQVQMSTKINGVMAVLRLDAALPALKGLHLDISLRNDRGWTREQIADHLEAQGR